MTISQFLIRVSRWNLLGKVIGAAVGLTAGVFGAFFGLLIGALVDEAARFARDRRSLVRLLEHQPEPGADDPLPLDVALIVLVAAVRPEPPHPESDATLCTRVAEICALTPRRTAELHHIASEARALAMHTTSTALVERVRPRLNQEQRIAVVDFLLSVGAEPARVRGVSDRLAVSADEYAVIRARWRRLDPQACAVLGVAPDAPVEEIKRVYRFLAGQFHPDAAGGLDDEQRRQAEEAYLRVQEAYRKIIDAYD